MLDSLSKAVVLTPPSIWGDIPTWALGISGIVVNGIIAYMAIKAFKSSERAARSTENSVNLTKQALELEERRENQRVADSMTANVYVYTDVVVSVVAGSTRDYTTLLVVANAGPSPAQHIEVDVAGEKVSIGTLGPGASTRWAISRVSGTVLSVSVTWQDARKVQCEFRADIAVVNNRLGTIS